MALYKMFPSEERLRNFVEPMFSTWDETENQKTKFEYEKMETAEKDASLPARLFPFETAINRIFTF